MVDKTVTIQESCTCNDTINIKNKLTIPELQGNLCSWNVATGVGGCQMWGTGNTISYNDPTLQVNGFNSVKNTIVMAGGGAGSPDHSISVIPGVTYTASVYVLTPTTGTYNAVVGGFGLLNNVLAWAVSSSVTVQANTITRLVVTFTVPNNVHSISFRPTTSIIGTFYSTCYQVEVGSTATDFKYPSLRPIGEPITLKNKLTITDGQTNLFSKDISLMNNSAAMAAGGTTPPTISQSTDYILSDGESTQSYKIQWNSIGGAYADSRVTGSSLVCDKIGRTFAIWVYAPIPFTVIAYVTGYTGNQTITVTVGPTWQRIVLEYRPYMAGSGSEYITFYSPSAKNVMYVARQECFLADTVLTTRPKTVTELLPSTPYFDDFEDGKYLNRSSPYLNWTLNAGSPILTNTNQISGNYSLQHTGTGSSTYNSGLTISHLTSNYTVEFDFKLTNQGIVSLTPYLHLFFLRYTDYNNWLRVDSYFDGNNQVIRLVKDEAGVVTTIKQVTWITGAKLSTGTVYHFKIVDIGSNVQLYINNVLYFSTSYTTTVQPGNKGCGANMDSVGVWDNLLIYSETITITNKLTIPEKFNNINLLSPNEAAAGNALQNLTNIGTNNATKTLDSTNGYNGLPYCIHIVTLGGGWSGLFFVSFIPCDSAHQYTVTALLKGSGTVYFMTEEHNITGTQINSQYSSAINLTSTYNQYSFTFTPKTGVTYFRVTIYTETSPVADFYYGLGQIEQGSNFSGWKYPGINELFSITNKLPISDNGVCVDNVLTIYNHLKILEQVLGSDTFNLKAVLNLLDNTHSNEILKITNNLHLPENVDITDILNILAELKQSEQSTTNELIKLLTRVNLDEESTVNESLFLNNYLQVLEFTQSEELINILVSLILDESVSSEDLIRRIYELIRVLILMKTNQTIIEAKTCNTIIETETCNTS